MAKTGRNKKDEKDKRKNIITVRLTDSELHILKKKAATYNIALSIYLREAAIKQKVKRYPVEVNQAFKHLSKIGNNINQVAKKINSGYSISKEDSKVFWQLKSELDTIYKGIINKKI